MRTLNYILVFFFCFALGSLVAQNTLNPFSEEYQQLKANGQIDQPQHSTFVGTHPEVFPDATTTGPLIPLDETFTQAMDRNDDQYTSEMTLPFDFTFYGDMISNFYINNNGNISFGGPFSTYSSTGFPVNNYPMLAPFWADVDTRNSESGLVYYRIEPNRLVVIWDHVGYYAYYADKLNTFELIVTDGTDPLIGIGNNVAFCYGDMQWTTGDASGGTNGFGGTPATVGINKGNGINYALIGRFDHEGTDYDGAAGNNDGVSYLDDKCFFFNTGVSFNNIPPVVQGTPAVQPIVINVGDSYDLTMTFLSPEAEQTTNAVLTVPAGFTDFDYVVTSGNVCTVEIDVMATMDNLGLHQIQIVATDDGVPPESVTVSLNFQIILQVHDTLNLCMEPGWQLISSYNEPEEAPLELVMAPLTNVDALVVMLNKHGIYWPAYNFNQIGDWNSHDAYKVKLAADGCIVFAGDEVMDKTVELGLGTNYLPMLSGTDVWAEDIFDQISGKLLYAFDIKDQLVYWPEGGLYTLNTLEPGKGYLVNMIEEGVVDYAGAKKSSGENQAIIIKDAPWTVDNTGTQHIISIASAALNQLEPGDIIGVFDNDGICTGMSQYQKAGTNLALVVWGDDNTTDAIDGMLDGEAIRLVQYRPATGEMLDLNPQWDAAMSHAGNYAEYGLSAIVSFKGATAVGDGVLNSVAIYPNPTTGLFHIDGINGATNIEVLNSTGRMVSKFTSNQSIEIDLSNMASGIYYLRLVSDKDIRIEKIIVE